MIRLPNRLASAWEEAPEGTVLGTLTFTKGGISSAGIPPAKRPKTSANAPASSSKISITIDPNLAESQSDLPVNYTLEVMTKKTPGALHPFTRNADGGVSIHGIISRTASAQVASYGGDSIDVNAGRYRTLLKNRLLDTTVHSKRFVRSGGLDTSMSGPGPLAAAKAAASLNTGFGGSVARFGKRMLDAKERGGLASTSSIGTGIGGTQEIGPVITGIEGVRSTLFEFFSKKQLNCA